MLIFWLAYFFLSFLISYSIYKIFISKFLSFTVALLFFVVTSSIWFVSPGSQELAPVITIFFLENTIVESNGYLRLVRPILLFLFIGIIFTLIYLFLKNKIFKK